MKPTSSQLTHRYNDNQRRNIGFGGAASITVSGTLGSVNVATGKVMPLSGKPYEVSIAITMLQRVTG
jgi:hypothetical protein